jgi:hypothetical protein
MVYVTWQVLVIWSAGKAVLGEFSSLSHDDVISTLYYVVVMTGIKMSLRQLVEMQDLPVATFVGGFNS